ncbi:MAG TPA: TAT (twin-arginine translocation) pathway signal sequence [Methylomusa anaerophila]|uniref:Uncharacterized protein n=1 Tax=Methylomusa anaerophila TaxID=1930071 RepID=A0A348AHG2_9FIRM|nr:TAT (twin-arginine translocation) pathway signal sequence [Methylomusa anaerophila]BBB90510.1 hypothetical protein MAMMFC1_01161 [Methylomusa anaerophila]HML89850.1 TAT (twin-arginine translocation) pathway signal sequence [Methylomusa anaerophila]
MVDMEKGSLSRRDFLRVTAGAASTLAVMSAIPAVSYGAAKAGTANIKAISLAECQALSPVDMANKSVLVKESYQFLLATSREISDAKLRGAVTEIIENPVPKVAAQYTAAGDREKLRKELLANGLLQESVTAENLLPPLPAAGRKPQPFESAPGSGYASHHSYPGGLPVHTALNVRSSLGLYNGYINTDALYLDKDVVIAAQLLHDLHKPWVFQWQDDASSLPEFTIAGTGAHHILSIAESIYRGLPAKVIVAQASAHDNPGTPEEEARVVNYLKAGAIIAGKDPVRLGLLAAGGKTIPLPRAIETFVTNLGDHDWVISVPAVKWAIPLLENIAKSDYKLSDRDLQGKPFYSFRNYVFSQLTIMGVHQLNFSQGEKAVREAVRNLVVPV